MLYINKIVKVIYCLIVQSKHIKPKPLLKTQTGERGLRHFK